MKSYSYVKDFYGQRLVDILAHADGLQLSTLTICPEDGPHVTYHLDATLQLNHTLRIFSEEPVLLETETRDWDYPVFVLYQQGDKPIPANHSFNWIARKLKERPETYSGGPIAILRGVA